MSRKNQSGVILPTLLIILGICITIFLALLLFKVIVGKEPTKLNLLDYGNTYFQPRDTIYKTEYVQILKDGEVLCEKHNFYSKNLFQEFDNKLYFTCENSLEVYSLDLKQGIFQKLISTEIAENSYNQVAANKIKLSKFGNLRQLNIKDNTLFVSYGVYMNPGMLLYVDLDDLSTVTKVDLDIPHPAIEQNDDEYIIHGFEGDACWGINYYAKFDIKNKKIIGTPLSFEYRCGDGQLLHGYDKEKKRYVYSEIKATNLSMGNTYQFLSLKTADLNGNSKTLLDKSKFSEDIMNVLYDEKDNIVYLTSNTSLYSYILSSGTLKKIGSYEDSYDVVDLSKTLSDGGICLYANSDYVLIDHTTAKKLSTPELCKTSEEVPAVSLYDSLKTISFPKGYEIKLVEKID